MKDWRKSPIAAGLVIAAFVATQFSIPISRLVDDTSRRFGWQMFSVTHPAPEFVAITSSGDVEIDLNEFVARARGDIDLAAFLPTHLCRVIPNTERITWQNGEHEC